MKHITFLLLIAGIFMTTACSTTGDSESGMDSSAEPTSMDSAEGTESAASTDTAMEEKSAPAAASSSTASGSMSDGSGITWVCTKNDSTRTIRVIYPDGGPKACEVTYEKSSGTQSLWNANNDKSYCEDKAIEFVTKQEGWGWNCNRQ